MKKTKNTLINNWIVKNIVLATVTVLAIVLIANIFLSVYTRHGKEVVVPDFTDMTFREARTVASAAGLEIKAGDSLYIRRLRPGVVYEQSPKAGAKVKPGRAITLSTNTYMAKQIPMPSLIGFSLRQAKAELQRNGLVLGKLIYEEDIATNNVMGQRLNGRSVSAGEMINGASVIDLVLGLNPSENMTIVPNLVGKSYKRAVDLIQENSLNVGRVRFESGVRTYSDSLAAKVFFQSPAVSEEAVEMGTAVSISLRVEE